jgi:hypothetical protein
MVKLERLTQQNMNKLNIPVRDCAPWIFLVISLGIACHAAHWIEKQKKSDPDNKPIEDALDPLTIRRLWKETGLAMKAWSDHLSRCIGLVLLGGAEAAVDTSHPTPYALSFLFLTIAGSAYSRPTFPMTIERFLRAKDLTLEEWVLYRKMYRTYFRWWKPEPFLYWFGAAIILAVAAWGTRAN